MSDGLRCSSIDLSTHESDMVCIAQNEMPPLVVEKMIEVGGADLQVRD